MKALITQCNYAIAIKNETSLVFFVVIFFFFFGFFIWIYTFRISKQIAIKSFSSVAILILKRFVSYGLIYNKKKGVEYIFRKLLKISDINRKYTKISIHIFFVPI